MKKYLFILLLIPGCVTQQRCFEKFPPDTIRVRTVEYRDTTVVIDIKGSGPVVNMGLISAGPVYAKSGTAEGKAWVRDSTVYIQVLQKDTTQAYELKNALKTIHDKETEIVTIKEKAQKLELIVKIFEIGGFIAVVILLIVLVKRFFKKR